MQQEFDLEKVIMTAEEFVRLTPEQLPELGEEEKQRRLTMGETLKGLLSSSSFNTFDENPDFNIADALLWIAIGLHKIADGINRGND